MINLLITTTAINDLNILASLQYLSLALSLSLSHTRSRRVGLQACKSRTRADLVLQVEDNGRIKSKTDIREEGDDWRRGTLKRKQMRQRLFYLWKMTMKAGLGEDLWRAIATLDGGSREGSLRMSTMLLKMALRSR